ncbi:MAG: NTP transferase domain-containing protein [Anaeroplasmataceae bacterium]|nr:NTP transferase domain-containing protein [Anaeroplasmataceae bacterium]
MNYAIVLAAEKGSRLNTELPKCAVSLLKKPMIEYVVDALKKSMVNQVICVVGQEKEILQDILKNQVEYVVQNEPFSMIHALKCASSFLKEDGHTLILPGDVPLVDEEILNQMISTHLNENNDVTIGKIKEETTDFYCIRNNIFLSVLEQCSSEEKKEYGMTDILLALEEKIKIGFFTFKDSINLSSVNDLYDLSCVEEEVRKTILKKHILNGVRIINPNSTTIASQVEIGAGTVIYSGCNLWGETKIGKNSTIGPNTTLENSIIEDNATCIQSVVSDSKICSNATVGPFAHIRMNSIIGEKDRIGNFVEIKNSVLGTKTNVAHLTYIGDTTCGDHVNWGCGCVTVNYDGKNKYRTTIGNDVFIGCNSNLIAPINIEDESFIAAGSTITSDVEEGAFAIARAKQVTKPGYASKYGFKK